MNSAVTFLSERGDADVAVALKEVADAVAKSAEIDEVRQREILEVLVALAEQAKLPADKRRTGVVRTLYEAAAGTLSVACDVAHVWSTFGPRIVAFFGLHG
jgi:hypothetical protein